MAVVSQPTNRTAAVELPGDLDPSLREFWVGNPWQIVAFGHNLSAYERNRAYLNVGGKDFLEISHLTGADSEGDGRAVVAVDFHNKGMLDLIVRQAGGGPLQLYENRLPQKGYLKVSLRGHESNKQGIGARLIATVDGRRIVRELYPANTFFSQAPSIVHFGLGEASKVEKLSIRWPNGKVQEIKDLKANRHVIIDEAVGSVEEIVPGRTILP